MSRGRRGAAARPRPSHPRARRRSSARSLVRAPAGSEPTAPADDPAWRTRASRSRRRPRLVNAAQRSRQSTRWSTATTSTRNSTTPTNGSQLEPAPVAERDPAFPIGPEHRDGHLLGEGAELLLAGADGGLLLVTLGHVERDHDHRALGRVEPVRHRRLRSIASNRPGRNVRNCITRAEPADAMTSIHIVTAGSRSSGCSRSTRLVPTQLLGTATEHRHGRHPRCAARCRQDRLPGRSTPGRGGGARLAHTVHLDRPEVGGAQQHRSHAGLVQQIERAQLDEAPALTRPEIAPHRFVQFTRILHRVPPQLDCCDAIVRMKERDLVGPRRGQLAGGANCQHRRQCGASGSAVAREDARQPTRTLRASRRRSRRGPTSVPP